MTEAPSRTGAPLSMARPRHLSRELLQRWEASLGEWDAGPRVLDAWRALADPRTRIVVTGQQPGPWGGPLYTFYKAATAIALAERLAEASNEPAVAVFWMQSEDTDWGEIGWGTLPQPDLRLYRHRFEPAVPARHWVGSARLTDPPEAHAVIHEWNASLEEIGPAGETYELGTRFARGLVSMFGGRGLLPLDGRWPELRLAGRPLWERYLSRHRQLASEVVARGGERSSPAPLDRDAASNGLFILDGEKRRPIDPATWEAEVSSILSSEPVRLAPSVLLRAPLQDHLFGPVAHVVGGVESMYLDQLHPVYEALGIVEPERVPRLSATVLPASLVPPSEREQAIADPEGWIAGRACAHMPADARRTVATLRRDLETGLDRLDRSLGQEQESAESLNSARRKIDFELKRLEETLERRGRRDLYREEPRLRHLGEFLRPRRGPQERGISAAMFPLCFEDARSVLLEAARDHAAAWSEGRAVHRVLEATRV